MSLKREIVRVLKAGARTAKQLRKATGTTHKKLIKALDDLKRSGQVRSAPGGYMLSATAPGATPAKRPGAVAKQADIAAIPAKIVKLGRSFGFAAPLDASADIFIPGASLHGAMPGDEVKVQLFSNPRVAGSREGQVLRVTQPNDRLVGHVVQEANRLYIRPGNAPDTLIAIKKGMAQGAKEGDRVAAKFIRRGEGHREHRAEVVRRCGRNDTAADSAQAILFSAGIQPEFPSGALAQAGRVADMGLADPGERLDLRGEVIFTIDSASTKDIDDAISLKREGDGYELGVHIADVSHYIAAHSPLDEEALQRGTSIYYADSVIPMLPPQLSNGICSLNPQEDRLAFSCLMQLDAQGNMQGYRFCKSLICSRVKGVYDEINQIFAGKKKAAITKKYAEVRDTLVLMYELYQKLVVLRAARGSMEIESDEPKLIINEAGVCVGVEKRARGEAERMIEEFMLLANTAAATLGREQEIPFVYRTHEKPAADRAEQLKLLLTRVGVPFRFKEDIPTQKELGALLDETRGTPLEKFVHTAVLRSMAKAKYEPLPKGHYGLALADYAHFTSPIRRYPDLAIHRILSDYAAGMPAKELRQKYTAFAQKASARSSETEIVAQKIERDCDDCYKAEYMKPFIGQHFSGTISSVMQFGIYVELDNTVEGLVHVSHLPGEHWDLVEGVSLTNPMTGAGYRIGDVLGVKLIGVDIAAGNIDFDLATEE